MPSYDECLVEAELRARAAYAGPERRYHGEQHLDDCLRKLARVDGLTEPKRRLLRWAILWHDAVYEPGRADNEGRSAELAERELTSCGVAKADAVEVARLIRLTKGHRADKADRLGAVLVSIDLSILGGDPDCYRAYSAAVRQEYFHVADAEWRQGRSLVLMDLLAADPLYPDPEFQNRFEAQARLNMAEEVKALSAN